MSVTLITIHQNLRKANTLLLDGWSILKFLYAAWDGEWDTVKNMP